MPQDARTPVTGDAANAASRTVSTQPVVEELRVSGHLTTLEAGLYCILLPPTVGADPTSGLPGVRISPAPGRSDAVQISSFHADGWLGGAGDAALVRVNSASAQLMVTIYQPAAGDALPPRLQVVRLMDSDGSLVAPAPVAPPPPAAPEVMDMVAHIQGRGDVGAHLGEWLGEAGSARWIEGFAVAPVSAFATSDIEYQAVLGRGWLSPWTEGGQFCGSRGMALPLLGLRVRLRGAAAAAFELTCSARFVDGSAVGPVRGGEACEADSLAPMEAFCLTVLPIGSAVADEPARRKPARRR